MEQLTLLRYTLSDILRLRRSTALRTPAWQERRQSPKDPGARLITIDLHAPRIPDRPLLYRRFYCIYEIIALQSAVMTMALPRPSTASTRPAYLDNLFRDRSPQSCPQHSASSSASSNNSTTTYDFLSHRGLSSSTSTTNLRSQGRTHSRDAEDRSSIRSLKPGFAPFFNVKKVFNRRTYPQAKEIVATELPLPSPPKSSRTRSPSLPGSRRPSLPKLQTSFSPPASRKGSKSSIAVTDKPLPAVPVQPAHEVSCHRCYYFSMRNCNGWVMGGNHGDACEQCLVCRRRCSSRRSRIKSLTVPHSKLAISVRLSNGP